MARTLALHVGHGKTGSSFLQSSCAASVAALEEAGVHFPAFEGMEEAARGGISSGNGAGLLGKPPRPPRHAHTVLYSSEKLFADLRDADFHAAVLKRADALKAERVAVLLFIRNPIGHLVSAYQQAIKRGGETRPIDEFSQIYAVPQSVHGFIRATAHPRLTLTIRNYSVHKGNIIAPFAQWLGISPTVFAEPQKRIVNRALTAGELALQRRLNAVIGRSGALLADPVCERLPHLEPARIAPALSVQHTLLAKLHEPMCAVNGHTAHEERYRPDVIRLAPGEEAIALEPEQADIIMESLGREIARLRAR